NNMVQSPSPRSFRLEEFVMLRGRAPMALAVLAAMLALCPAPRSAAEPKAAEMVAKVKKAAGIDLVAIPGQGEDEFFYMGSATDDKDAYDDEKPRHKVRISKPFYLGETKVTV